MEKVKIYACKYELENMENLDVQSSSEIMEFGLLHKGNATLRLTYRDFSSESEELEPGIIFGEYLKSRKIDEYSIENGLRLGNTVNKKNLSSIEIFEKSRRELSYDLISKLERTINSKIKRKPKAKNIPNLVNNQNLKTISHLPSFPLLDREIDLTII